MKTINIKGKEYVPVNERVKEFREKYPDHKILSEIISLDDNSVVMVAKVYDGEGNIVACGHAQEDRNASNINKTSYVENCETSAIGRALGMFGIGIDASMASADEVANAIAQQEVSAKKVGKNEISALKIACEEKDSSVEKILSFYGLSAIEDMNFGQWNEAMKILAKKPSK